MTAFRVQTLARGVHAFVQEPGETGVSNCGIVATGETAVLVDSLLTPSMARRLMWAVSGLVRRPVSRVVHTHGHIDHIGGDGHFPSAEVWADPKTSECIARMPEALNLCRRWMPRWADELKRIRFRLPDRILSGGPLPGEGPRIEVLPLGRAHSASDVAFYLPDQRVVFAGDLAFFNVTPLLLPEGDLGGWLSAVETLLELPARWIVPGHGPAGGPAELRRLRRYLLRLAEHGRDCWEAGLSLSEAVALFPLGEFRKWAEPDRLVVNLLSVYRGCAGAPPPRTVAELEEVLAPAVEFLGQGSHIETERREGWFVSS
jgi:cyclase